MRWVGRVVAAAAVCVATVGAARAETFYMAKKSELCVDIKGGRFAEGTPVMLWPCHGKAPQILDYDAARKQVVARANRAFCVDDIVGQGLALVRCNAIRIKWTYDAGSAQMRSQDGRCWDARGGAMAPGTRMILWPCHGKANQQIYYY
jgi:hypothetical protein